jgi:cytolysin (calcineurin-like family phosphatase)
MRKMNHLSSITDATFSFPFVKQGVLFFQADSQDYYLFTRFHFCL